MCIIYFMKKSVVAIFAHPDDEAFGPSGTLALMAQQHDVYLLCATRGEAGTHFDISKQKDIASIREAELKKSTSLLGIKETHFLNFVDGELCNNKYHALAREIEKYLLRYEPETIITYEQRGVSGHIDHIVVTSVATFIGSRLPFVKNLMYFCISNAHQQNYQNYFIHCPRGCEREEVDIVVDVSSVWDKKIAALQAHESQKKDVEKMLGILTKLPQEEYFFARKK